MLILHNLLPAATSTNFPPHEIRTSLPIFSTLVIISRNVCVANHFTKGQLTKRHRLFTYFMILS